MEPSRRAVRDTYDRIAAHFAKTREHPWEDVSEFVASSRRCGTALDLGCGNGRHAELLADRADRVVGADISTGSLATARERARDGEFAVELVQCDAARLPFGAASVDLCVYVAALHHLPTGPDRVASLDEVARVLDASGRGLVAVWSTEHDAFDSTVDGSVAGGETARTEGFDTTVDWTLPDGEVVGRYYHIYAPAEFEDDLHASALRVERTFVSRGNCYAVVSGSETA